MKRGDRGSGRLQISVIKAFLICLISLPALLQVLFFSLFCTGPHTQKNIKMESILEFINQEPFLFNLCMFLGWSCSLLLESFIMRVIALLLEHRFLVLCPPLSRPKERIKLNN